MISIVFSPNASRIKSLSDSSKTQVSMTTLLTMTIAHQFYQLLRRNPRGIALKIPLYKPCGLVPIQNLFPTDPPLLFNRWPSVYDFRNRTNIDKYLIIDLTAAFKSEYLGDNHKFMLQAVDQLVTEKHHAHILPVVQSSGTGKTRTLYKIAEDRIVIQMCIREADYPGIICELILSQILYYYSFAIAYPASDAQLGDFFRRAPSPEYKADCKNYLRGFLISLSRNFHKKLEIFADEIKKRSSLVSYKRLVRKCFKLFDSERKRKEFYTQVVEDSHPTTHVQPFRTALEGISTFFRTTCYDFDDLPLIMAIDEIHVLYKTSKGSRTSHTVYSRLSSVLSEVRRYRFCVVSMSTTLPDSDVAPYEKTTTDLPDPVPFTALSFDPFVTAEPLKPYKIHSETAGQLGFMVKFGRPLSVNTHLIHCALMNDI